MVITTSIEHPDAIIVGEVFPSDAIKRTELTTDAGSVLLERGRPHEMKSSNVGAEVTWN
jgi:hypothetical protein